MKKKYLISLFAASMIFSVGANAKTKVDEIKELKAKIKELQERLDDIEDNLGEVETRTLTDKINFGIGMRIEANNIDTTYADGSSPKEEDIIYRTKLNLNMKAKISSNLKFTGRLSLYKNWGDSHSDNGAYANIDSRQGRMPDNHSELYVERAYLDWMMNPGSEIPVTMTLGRQPSSDGPSFQIKEGQKRKGTYDALAFDGAADGIVFTANLKNYNKGLYARIAYGVPASSSQSNDTNATLVQTSTVKDTKVTGFFIDKYASFLGKQDFIQAYYVSAKDFNADASGRAGLSDVNVGDFDLYGAMYEVKGMGKLDFFAHLAYSKAKPNGNSMQNPTDKRYYGLLSNNSGEAGGDTSTKSGHAYWLGARYNINKKFAVGAEYNKGSKNWFSFTYAPNYPLNKLATRGDAVEVYGVYNINRYANLRVGYIDINYDYTGSGAHLGEPQPINSNLGNKAIKEKKNTYITFNVLF